jgi:hypothetical protein
LFKPVPTDIHTLAVPVMVPGFSYFASDPLQESGQREAPVDKSRQRFTKNALKAICGSLQPANLNKELMIINNRDLTSFFDTFLFPFFSPLRVQVALAKTSEVR